MLSATVPSDLQLLEALAEGEHLSEAVTEQALTVRLASRGWSGGS